MKIEQIYTGCLAQASYYIECNGEAAVIDPLRDIDVYINKAKDSNATIKYIFETHFHADFVSGHLSLSKLTNASIIFGPKANPKFDAIIAAEGDEFKLGDATIKTIHTPGHTLESTSFLLLDKENNPHSIFTGDTLFLGDVGIPDVAQRYQGVSKEELAGILYDSINNKIKPLDGNVTVYPGHGAGSACGKNMMKETVDSLGNQKIVNYALNGKFSKTEFIKELTDNLPEPPSYFPSIVKMNQDGYDDITDILKRSLIDLSPEKFKSSAESNQAVILDTRDASAFCEAHIPGSLFIGLSGSFAPWVGMLVKGVNQPILIVSDENKKQEAIMRLSRVGYDNCIGFLDGGIQSWSSAGFPTAKVDVKLPVEIENSLSEIRLIDVRRPGEYNAEHIENIDNLPLDTIFSSIGQYDSTSTYHLHCQSGYRSVIAASILKANGIQNVVNIVGGIKLIKETTNFNYVTNSCSSET